MFMDGGGVRFTTVVIVFRHSIREEKDVQDRFPAEFFRVDMYTCVSVLETRGVLGSHQLPFFYMRFTGTGVLNLEQFQQWQY